MKTPLIALSALLLASLVTLNAAAPEAGSQTEVDKALSWTFTPDPALPNVLILGDSISIGYTLQVRALLKGKANVFRAMTPDGQRQMNCNGTTVGLKNLDQWIGGHTWSVIHFNWGLHDLKHVRAVGIEEKSDDPLSPTQATIEVYQSNLEAITKKLKATGARLIFATTTPVVPGTLNPLREPDAPGRYNAVAVAIMKAHGVEVNDLFAFCEPHLAEWQQSKNVHFKPAGNVALAQEVAQRIEQALAHKPSEAAGTDGFVKLFNGKNWDGWYLKIKSGDAEMAKKVFAIEDGMVHVFNDSFPNEHKLGTGENDTHGLFYTNKKYSKYIFRFEYKWGQRIANNFAQWQYDAGCFYHVIDDKIWPTGIEYQIRYDHTKSNNHTGDLIRPGGVKYDWYMNETGATYLHPKDGGKLYTGKGWMHLAAPTKNHHALDNQWNQCELIVMGSEYAIHKLNGKVVNMAFNLNPSAGIIGLQSETAEIYYRNIEIKEFDAVIPAEQFLNQP